MIAEALRAVAAAEGYATAGYAASLSHRGEPLHLPGCDGWLLRCHIAGGGTDASGAYPLFACRDWRRLADDLANLTPDLLSVAAVIDPFATIGPDALAQAFPDRCVPFKQHFVRDLAAKEPVAACHQRNVRAAAAEVEVEACLQPDEHVDEWCRLYDGLVARHAIIGPAVFSRSSFVAQLALPDLRAFRALRRGRTVGMVLWLLGPEAAYYHLAAYDDEGYRAKASFALFDVAISTFRAQGIPWLALGGAAGVTTAESGDGLTRFKEGWATETRTAWFGGRVLDRRRYAELSEICGDTTFFPAYRAPPAPPRAPVRQ